MPVGASTVYTLSLFVKTDAPLAGGSLSVRACRAGSTTDVMLQPDGSSPAEVTGITDTSSFEDGWQRVTLTYKTDIGQFFMRPVLVYVRTSGVTESFHTDAWKNEEGYVATGWVPGSISGAVVLDVNGAQFDASKGAIVRLRGSAGGVRDTVELGSHGLFFGGDTEFGGAGTAFPTGPSTNEIFYRTDLGMWFYYDGTRWLSETQFTLPYDRKTYSANGFSEEQFVMRPSGLGYWVTGCYLNLNVATTHSNTNKWTLETYDEAAAVRATMPDSWATAPAVGTSYHQFNALGYANNAGVNGERSRLRCTKVGAPGDLTISAAISYRLIGT